MKFLNNFKNSVIEMASVLYMSLFVYAAASKLLEFENFQAQLGQSPILGAYTGILSYAVITSELILAVLLAFSKTRLFALYSGFGLMAMFTVYIVIILNFSSNIPCSCGGVLENMGWKQHLIFNIFFIVLAFSAIIFNSVNYKKSGAKLCVIMVAAAIVISVLYFRSEHIMQKENPFIRRFTPGSSRKISETKLHNNTLYFAGADSSGVYIADQKAPLHIFKYDTALKVKHHYKIQLDKTDFPFRSVQVKIIPPYFFVIDGTVPVIYRGKISDWKAKVLMSESGYYFSKAVAVDSLKISFRTQAEKSGENTLGLFSFENNLKSTLYPRLLQKQIDGVFDTDGMMNYSVESRAFVYVYYYRNQYIVTDDKLNLMYRDNTIDTMSRAAIKPVFIKDKGQRTLASPANAVNKLSTLRNTVLFVNSSVIGQYEPKEMWDTAVIVDAYNLSSRSYISSIYIYNSGGSKMKDMTVWGNSLYVIAGKYLQRYRLDKDLKIKTHNLSADSRGED
ncbi:DoxX family protein [Flavobacterium sp. 1355]|uniref:DoxX family protein n=1 Tax=Flavobacterium sp. 1355 TaxID=2806571 RepID=UPI001AEA93AF|nr:DoxX family protein [Flavobacterium sp. 1355]MBP1222349.1 putative membrane protein YphA (DoxX/SURF4 family) [Flavobacterium sp. 1355]